MIPSDVASGLRAVIPDQQSTPQSQTQPVAPAQRISDVLSNLVPGQRIFAEVQGMLANGTYRATVAQRDITLALPFAAKAGDSLELEVAESNGKLTLAFVANRGEGGDKGQQSVATSLSQAGKLIGDLIQGLGGDGKRAAPAALNGNQALVPTMPKTGADLAPVLKQALTQSGMFYESHQARWVAGQLPLDNLRQEPQGRLVMEPPAGGRADQPLLQGTGVPREIAPLVQQQLDGLANQNFAWQGQIWPGQKMWWEIGENPEDRNMVGDEPGRWHTRIKLSLPQLGGIDADLRLQKNGELGVRIVADSPASESRLQSEMGSLLEQMAAAGLNVGQVLISHERPEES